MGLIYVHNLNHTITFCQVYIHETWLYTCIHDYYCGFNFFNILICQSIKSRELIPSLGPKASICQTCTEKLAPYLVPQTNHLFEAEPDKDPKEPAIVVNVHVKILYTHELGTQPFSTHKIINWTSGVISSGQFLVKLEASLRFLFDKLQVTVRE